MENKKEKIPRYSAFTIIIISIFISIYFSINLLKENLVASEEASTAAYKLNESELDKVKNPAVIDFSQKDEQGRENPFKPY